ncbi:MFS transporter [Pilimelia anulata]|uniref:MFS transporter n=1 Tax=Pilimelia anulata TaxID=53371 RepID=A0A8J3B7H6_9ACTN|nr:MFS transporter [Pilimelia anulata]GGJ81683.1 MFS transporter [Pilimelia anulata]
MATNDPARPPRALRKALLPLALAQFVCSFAGSNMNVMINDISRDLDTTVQGVQLAITIFLLVMAALMIPGGKLTDRYGRKRCFTLGLVIYGIGTLLSVVAPGLPLLIFGNSILQGVGTALLIPPVYILTTLLFTDVASRARAFGAISAMAGIGAAAGPLIGGFITSALGWRWAFAFQALIVAVIIGLSRRFVRDPLPAEPDRPFDTGGAVLSALGLLLLVMGILAADDSGWLALALVGCGSAVLAAFVVRIRARERSGRAALLSTALFRSRTANLGMVTQNLQWLMLMGISFVVAAYLQVVLGRSAIETGLIMTAATVGLLIASLAAERLAKRRPQRTLVLAGFATTVAGIAVLLLLAAAASATWAMLGGLFLIGLGIGAMLTPSVNLVQSSFGEGLQGEISGLSRSVSNLGSSLGAALASTIIVVGPSASGASYAVAMAAVGAVGLAGLGTALFLPRPAPATAAGAR